MTKGGGRHGLQKSSPWQMVFSLLWRGLNRIMILWFIVGGGEALNWVNCWTCGTGRTCHRVSSAGTVTIQLKRVAQRLDTDDGIE